MKPAAVVLLLGGLASAAVINNRQIISSGPAQGSYIAQVGPTVAGPTNGPANVGGVEGGIGVLFRVLNQLLASFKGVTDFGPLGSLFGIVSGLVLEAEQLLGDAFVGGVPPDISAPLNDNVADTASAFQSAAGTLLSTAPGSYAANPNTTPTIIATLQQKLAGTAAAFRAAGEKLQATNSTQAGKAHQIAEAFQQASAQL